MEKNYVQEKLKLAGIHYTLGTNSDKGVFHVLNNNVKGILKKYPNIEAIFLANRFGEKSLKQYEKRQVNLKTHSFFGNLFYSDKYSFEKDLTEASKDADAIIIENAFRKLKEYPTAPQEFKKFVENNPKKTFLIRYHDVDLGLKDVVPTTPNAIHVTLVQPTKELLKKHYGIEAEILKNSVICEKFYRNAPETDNQLRKILEMNNFVKPREKIIACPNRIVDRKNIEEAIMLTKMFNYLGMGPHRLIVTTDLSGEKNRFQKQYHKDLELLAKYFGIPCTLGGVSEILDDVNFNVGHLYHISDFALSTSVREGFGLIFLEPWLAEIALLARNIDYVVPDFKANGLKLDHFYDNDVLEDGPDYKIRMKNVYRILSNENLFKETVKKLDLVTRLEDAKSVIKHNKQAVEKNYNHVEIAEQLLNLIYKNQKLLSVI